MRAENPSQHPSKGLPGSKTAGEGQAALRVPFERLTTRVDPKGLGFDSTQEVPALEGTVGQDRALRALEFGLHIQTPGYNVFVTGMSGTGRNTTLSSYLEQVATTRPTPSDWCYVYNFIEPLKPQAIRLPPGTGHQLEADMDDLMSELRRQIPLIFEGADYRRHVEEAGRDIQEKHQQISQDMENEAKRRGVTLAITPAGVAATALGPSGKPLEREEFEQLSEAEQEELRKRHEELFEYVQQRSGELRQLEKQASRVRQDLDKELATGVNTPLFEVLRAKYHNQPEVLHYLDQVQGDVIAHLGLFRGGEAQPAGATDAMMGTSGPTEDEWVRYRVNVLISHHDGTGAPVIFEASPTYYNVFGRVDHQFRMGAMSTDFTQIRAGALHRANGGFLVFQAQDMLSSPFVW